jgi:hypothetical protein
MLAAPRQETILLSETAGEEAHLDFPARVLRGARRIGSMAELVSLPVLPSVAVLVLDTRPVPTGRLLAALGRLNLEYPGIEKVALLSGDPPLEVVTYLTSCGVHILFDRSGDESDPARQMAAVVARLKERARWNAS